MIDEKTITILGKRWRLIYASMRKQDGQCESPTQSGKKILVSRAVRRNPRRLMEVLIHECLHAADWHKDEEWIAQVADDITRILRREGFIHANEGEG